MLPAHLIRVQHTMTNSFQFYQIPSVSWPAIRLGHDRKSQRLNLNLMVSFWLEIPCKQQTKTQKQTSHVTAKGPKRRFCIAKLNKSLVLFQSAAHSRINIDPSARKKTIKYITKGLVGYKKINNKNIFRASINQILRGKANGLIQYVVRKCQDTTDFPRKLLFYTESAIKLTDIKLDM